MNLRRKPRMLSRFRRAFQRRAAKWFGRKPHHIALDQPIITFTFDDFPSNAATLGNHIVAGAGAKATYYTAHGLAGTTIATGAMFGPEDVHAVLRDGHELGCHTYNHNPAGETKTATYLESVRRNRDSIKASFGVDLRSHSYPISCPKPSTKRQLSGLFQACRAGGQTFNLGTVDLNYLQSFFLEQSANNFPQIKAVIEQNARSGGWLIFSTHDVADNPTKYGVTPQVLEATVAHAMRSGALLLSMTEAMSVISVPKV